MVISTDNIADIMPNFCTHLKIIRRLLNLIHIDPKNANSLTMRTHYRYPSREYRLKSRTRIIGSGSYLQETLLESN